MKHFALTLATMLLLLPLAETAAVAHSYIHPGQPWLDTDGVVINAHGFCIVPHEGKYYWYGAHKIPGKTEDEIEFGSRTNSETLRAGEIEARIDGAKSPAETLAALKTGWENPPATYRPHTRWWWPGNAVTKEGIDFQLQEMKDKGFGGVEIMSFTKVFPKGNIDYDSDEFVAMVKYTVDKARELGMEVTPPLSPGWGHGHPSVPEKDGGKAMDFYEADVDGGHVTLDLSKLKGTKWGAIRKRKFDALLVVALKPDGKPDTTRIINLTDKVSGSSGIEQFTQKPDLQVDAVLPAGRWRLMMFATILTGQRTTGGSVDGPMVDHLQKTAVENYLHKAGDRFAAALGGDYGQTVNSFFGDSFEIWQAFIYWSTGLYERFEKEKGYDLRPYLPILVYGGVPETPYVRYDVNSFLDEVGMDDLVRPLADHAAENHVAMRQQPHYRFVSDIIKQSGVYQIPETENTKRSFDPMFWHKLTTSGAWLYPSKQKKWVSAEAFTFIDDRYRTTMEEIKRATDLFLRDGVTQFYNHGYFYTPEKELSPSRDMKWMNRISHVNTWWPWYRGLADYQARAAFLSRQGRPESDVLVYAPYPTMWSERGKYPVGHVRDLPVGALTKILVANGYDFDFANDELLTDHARIDDGKLSINCFDYSVLILPRALTLPPETLEKIAAFVKAGGTVMALDNLPKRAGGLMNREANDARMAGLRDELFNPEGGMKTVGKGQSWFFPDFDGLEYLKEWAPWSVDWTPTAPLSAPQAKFIKALRSRLAPDFEIADAPQSNGLTFRHTKIGEVDAWFICNLQPNARKTEVTLKTAGKVPQVWNAMTGAIQSLEGYRFTDDGRIVIPVDLQPWASEFVLLTPPDSVELPKVGKKQSVAPEERMELSNDWNVSFQGLGNFKEDRVMKSLTDWTKIPGLENFSGTATYSTEFDLTPEIIKQHPAIVLDLGEVHEVASVRVNGQETGKVWMQPYRLDITQQVRPGKNRIEITVANLLWNFAAGVKKPAPIPPELQAHYGTEADPGFEASGWSAWRFLQTIKKDRKNDRLPSGLLGPVQVKILEP